MRTAFGMLLLSVGCASARSSAADRTAVVALYDEYNSIFVSRDFPRLEQIAQSDLLHVTASGHVTGLADLEKGLAGPDARIESVTSDNHEVRVVGDTAIV